MAIIKKIKETELDRINVHSEVDATICKIDINGIQYLQIDTSGSEERQIKGKTSQSNCLSEEVFKQIFNIAKKHY